MPAPATAHQTLAASVTLAIAIKHLAQLVDLSALQRTQLRTLRQESGARVEELAGALAASRRSLAAQIENEVFDEMAIRRAAGRVAAAEAELAVERAWISSSVRSILTEAQRRELKRLQDLPN